jgi:ribosome biogenesis protein BMS1
MKVHILGTGDFFMQSVSVLPDPCPLPDKKKSQSLSKKEVLLHAPMSNVGNIVFDSDAVYIRLGQQQYNKEGSAPDQEQPGDGVSMMRSLQGVELGMDDQQQDVSMSLFKNSTPVRADEVADEESADDFDDNEPGEQGAEDTPWATRTRRPWKGADEEDGEDDNGSGEDDDDDDEHGDEDDDDEQEDEHAEDGTSSKWKESLSQRAAASFMERQQNHVDLIDLVYGQQKAAQVKQEDEDAPVPEDDEESEPDDENFFKVKKTSDKESSKKVVAVEEEKFDADKLDCSRMPFADGNIQSWDDDTDLQKSIRYRFVTGGEKAWGNQVADEAGDDSGSEMGDFEDLETGEKFGNKSGSDSEDQEDVAPGTDKEMRDKLAAEKAKKKSDFDKEYDEEHDSDTEQVEAANRKRDEQAARNKEEFGEEGQDTRMRHEGIRNGQYVRIEFAGMPVEFVRHFNPEIPVVIGGLLPHEHALGLIRLRLKRHRWHKRVLKCNDPYVFSMGWRRFQSCPLFSTEDSNERHRYLKYTPEHMHCNATIYGPVCPPNTGIIAFKSLSSAALGFRVCATGNILELDHTFKVMKKLKLVGTPKKIYKNTAFVGGMFNSELEVAKFEGASLKTVSGIRGQLKKAQAGGNGVFRATFEDKILTSDIVFCRTWVPVKPRSFYNPVCSNLVASGKQWQGMRTTGQLRHDREVALVQNKDSVYKVRSLFVLWISS